MFQKSKLHCFHFKDKYCQDNTSINNTTMSIYYLGLGSLIQCLWADLFHDFFFALDKFGLAPGPFQYLFILFKRRGGGGSKKYEY